MTKNKSNYTPIEIACVYSNYALAEKWLYLGVTEPRRFSFQELLFYKQITISNKIKFTDCNPKKLFIIIFQAIENRQSCLYSQYLESR